MSRRKPKLPMAITVEGARRLVVGIEKDRWIEREPSGRLVHHVGKLLLDGQSPSKWIDEPRKCSRCKQLTHTTTKLGRPIHDTCEGWLNVMPDELAAQVIFGVAVDLGAQIIFDSPKETHRDRRAA